MNDIAHFMKSSGTSFAAPAALADSEYKSDECKNDDGDNNVLNCAHVFGDAFPIVAQHGTSPNEKSIP